MTDAMWQMAGQTTVVGMGVVFVALFLLSVYMHYFKVLIARLEGRRRTPVRPEPAAEAEAPEVAPAPQPPAEDPGGRIAACVGVALALEGVRGAPGPQEAAAIATAVALHRARAADPVCPSSSKATPPWRLAGRLAAMGGRVARQERVGR